MKTPSDLGLGESPRLNIAYPQKACKLIIHVLDEKRGVVSKVKVKLLEPHPLVTSGKGLVHAWSRYYGMISAKLLQALIGYIARQAQEKV